MDSNTSSDMDFNIHDKNGQPMHIPPLKKNSSETDLYLKLLANPVKSKQDSEKSTSSLHLENKSRKSSTSSIKRLSLNNLKMSSKKESFKPTKTGTNHYSEKHHSDKHYTEKHHSDKHYTDKHHSDKHHTDKHHTDKHTYTDSETDKNNSSRARYEKVDVSSDRTITPELIKLTPHQLRIKKTDLLRKLCDLKVQGYELTREYNFNSDISEMENEYELLKSFKQRRDGIKLYKNTIINVCNLVEFFNGKYDPFGADLNGWSEHMSIEVDSYDEVLEELYEKYKSMGKNFPCELKLLILIGFSASAFHFTKKHMSNIPGSTNMPGSLQSGITRKIASMMGKDKSKFMTDQEHNIEKQKEAFRQRERNMKEAVQQKYTASMTHGDSEIPATQKQTPSVHLQNGFHPVNYPTNMMPYGNMGPPNMNIPSLDQRDASNNRPLVQSDQSVRDILKKFHERTVDTQEDMTATNDRLVSDTTGSETTKRGRRKKPLMTVQ